MDELRTWEHFRAPLADSSLDDPILRAMPPDRVSFVFHYYADTFAHARLGPDSLPPSVPKPEQADQGEEASAAAQPKRRRVADDD